MPGRAHCSICVCDLYEESLVAYGKSGEWRTHTHYIHAVDRPWVRNRGNSLTITVQ
ncbi:hypothetical protein SCLCIDRAFT_1219604 [Scleroderma citrinum Foug A]|uniref:Uncharacterized protein n=1 Tax=Scleroderma citrinum Foug A TaxID=1036808 RepID=A0A0C2ZXT7_9AGAM|nr:hypothetical protein SCLCIDRAFT_1219604 [Scleroderma citrinum Foug A]